VSRLRVTSVRPAEAADLNALAEIENRAGRRFDSVMDTSWWPSAPDGRTRSQDGTVLVVGQPIVGFIHVTHGIGRSHIEEIAVLPEFGRHGIGTMLLRAALGVALDRGDDLITLTTFADVAWNRPWYAVHGFTPWVGAVPADLAERRIGELPLERGGRRVLMVRQLRDDPKPIPAVSVIPLRDGPGGLEGFVQYRVATMDFAANAVVFPGGRIDADDRESAAPLPAEVSARHTAAWRDTTAADVGGPATLVATGRREVGEEAAADVDATDLVPWDNWITPIDTPKRFDVYFFVAPVRGAAAATWRHTTSEAHDSRWERLVDVARAAETGELLLLPPTRTIVDELVALGSLAAVLTADPRIRPVRHDLEGPRPRAKGSAAR
jgi:8-oxo-dGTP pyrophosphatase MutT (NUDIX family)/GNAT superfamily N-acetyltransferase